MKKLSRVLSREEIYIVGGALRDRLLGRSTNDIDLLVETNPLPIAETIASEFGGSFFPLDEDRKILRIQLGATIQLDLARRAGSSLQEDLNHRDFKLNTLVLPLKDWNHPRWKKRILDTHGSLADIKKRKISIVGSKTFDEDPLRLLRAFRFCAELNFSLDPAIRQLIKRKHALIKKSSPERIHDELLKIFSTHQSYNVLIEMDKSGLLESIYPESKAMRRIAPIYYGKGGVLKHTLESIYHFEEIMRTLSSWFPKTRKRITTYLHEPLGSYPRFAQLKWALLLHDIGKPKTANVIQGRLRFFNHEHVGAELVQKMPNRYRWSVEETQRYSKLVRHHMRPGNLAVHEEVSDRALYRFFRDLGEDAVGMLLVSLGDHLTYLSPRELKRRNSLHELMTKRMINLYYHKREKVVPPKILDGHDLMNAFVLPPSPFIGELLNEVKEAQSEGRIHSKEEALNYLKDRVENQKAHSNS